MKAKASIITKYDEADSSGKVDLICRYYPNFLGIVDGYTEGLCYVIENEKSYNRKASRGDLGVRVQSSGHYSDVTADAAIENVVTIEAIISCDFSDGILDGVDRAREFLKEALILRDMRRHYELFNKQLGIAREYPYKKETRIIFLTYHIEEMPNGYKVRAFRFLTKPIEPAHFEEALFSAIRDIEQDKRFTVTDEEGEHIIRSSEIFYLESQQRSTGVRTRERFARLPLSIEEMKKELDMTQFYCPHKSYIVNMDFIRTIDKGVVILKNDEKIKISRLKMKDFKEKFYDYLRSRANGF